jgi:hypothetical protein
MAEVKPIEARRDARLAKLRERRLSIERRKQLNDLLEGLELMTVDIYKPAKKASLSETRKAACAALVGISQLLRQEVWRMDEEREERGMVEGDARKTARRMDAEE